MDDPARVVFTANATHGLNIAIKTLVRPGSRVIISGYEHNAVTRPLHGIPNVELTVVDTPLFRPEAMLAEFEQALDAGFTLDAVTVSLESAIESLLELTGWSAPMYPTCSATACR